MTKVPRWRKSDNIKRLLSARRAAGLVKAFGDVQAKNAPWVFDPDGLDGWWDAVIRDPRSHRTFEVSLGTDHPEAHLRLDRVAKRCSLITFKCVDCKAGGTLRTENLLRERGPSANVNALGEGLFNCPDKYARRNGRYCVFRFIEGGNESDVGFSSTKHR
jgi:hypothetical protein